MKKFYKKRRGIKYREIFSTTEKGESAHNTEQLDVKNKHSGYYALLKYNEIKDEFLRKELSASCPEYSGPLYTHAVKDSLKKEIASLNKEVFALILILILSVCWDFLAKFSTAFLSSPYLSASSLHLIVSTFLLALTFIFCFKTIKKACVHISKAIFTFDTSFIFSAFVTFLNCLISLVLSFLDANFQPNTFVSLFVLNFTFIVSSFLTNKKRVFSNLRFITSSKQKFNVEISPLKKITNAHKYKKNIHVVYQHPTNFLKNFIKNSHKEASSEKIVSKFILINIMFSAACGIATLILTKNIQFALVSVNICALLLQPFALPFVSNSVISSLCKFALRNRAMIISENALKKLTKAKIVVLSDSDLYPQNNVVLRGIKTFDGQRVDEAIILAATLVCRLGAPISHVFNKIILGKRAVLTKASNVKYVDGKGASGWVNGQRVLVGNRELLKEYKIAPPSHDYEEKYKMPNCELTYFAVGRELVAMFILEYLPSKSLCKILHSCVRNNIKIFIKTVDCNITLSKIASDFSVKRKNLALLSNQEKQLAEELCQKVEDKSEASVATLGNCSSLLYVMCEAINARNKILFAIFVQFLQLAVNSVIVIYLTANGSIFELNSIEWLLSSIFWLFFSLTATRIKKF